ncbi:MAG: hypothetical protein K6C36_05720 [Clostridia bacterium]|nr:hypothetical protein [Clostridia bacterium]
MTASEILKKTTPGDTLPTRPPDAVGEMKNSEGGIRIELWAGTGREAGEQAPDSVSVISAARGTAFAGAENDVYAKACAAVAAEALVGKPVPDVFRMSRAFCFYNVDDLPNDKIFFSPMCAEACAAAAARLAGGQHSAKQPL